MGAGLQFDTTGKLPKGTTLTMPAAFTPPMVASKGGIAASADPMTLTFDFSDSTQYGSAFGVSSLVQDGYTTGMPSGFNISPDGTILGRYTNGQSAKLGQVTIANFANPQGLQPLGNNRWAPTSAAGTPLPGTPGTASLGVLQSGAVEDANVDLTGELVSMIVAQRVYQANAQSIKTQDAVLQTITNLR
jgi:flagellar hook protein FlgE